jgi:hypothetical protein
VLSMLLPTPARPPGAIAGGPSAPAPAVTELSPQGLHAGPAAVPIVTPTASPAGVDNQQGPGQDDSALGFKTHGTTKAGLSHVLAGAAVPVGRSVPGGPGAGAKGGGKGRGGTDKSVGPLSAGLKAALAALATKQEAAAQGRAEGEHGQGEFRGGRGWGPQMLSHNPDKHGRTAAHLDMAPYLSSWWQELCLCASWQVRGER